MKEHLRCYNLRMKSNRWLIDHELGNHEINGNGRVKEAAAEEAEKQAG